MHPPHHDPYHGAPWSENPADKVSFPRNDSLSHRPSNQPKRKSSNRIPHRSNGTIEKPEEWTLFDSELSTNSNHRLQKVGGMNVVNGKERKGLAQDTMVDDDEDPEDSRWIHRDKLAIIESQEMREMGIPEASYPSNPDLSSDWPCQHSTNRYHYGMPRNEQEGWSTNGAQHHQHQNSSHARTWSNHDPRTLGESSAEVSEEDSHMAYHLTGQRTASSRIPLSTSSPIPVPQERIERTTPLPRKRGTSGNWGAGDEEGLFHSKVRSRSHSVGSQVLLDDGEALDGSPPSTARPSKKGALEISPAKVRPTSKQGLGPGQRKILAGARNASGVYKQRSTSTNARVPSNQRPTTRSGIESRPVTARPEGEAPWLATMYKPDPRLPPEEQLLPTLAKRLQQEQWEREGKVRPDWDQEFNTPHLHDDKLRSPPRSVRTEAAQNDLEPAENGTWPLNVGASDLPRSPSISTEHAGYSTVPRVQNTPSVGPMPSPRLPQPMQVQEPSKPVEGKKKGLGCCIIM
ncbi:MAG: hypothetical protein Q9187_000730 [Circinaria calcarea]